MEDIILPAMIGMFLVMLFMGLLASIIKTKDRETASCSEFKSYRLEDVPWRCIEGLPDDK